MYTYAYALLNTYTLIHVYIYAYMYAYGQHMYAHRSRYISGRRRTRALAPTCIRKLTRARIYYLIFFIVKNFNYILYYDEQYTLKLACARVHGMRMRMGLFLIYIYIYSYSSRAQNLYQYRYISRFNFMDIDSACAIASKHIMLIIINITVHRIALAQTNR